jgi:CBS domain-containing protein
MKVSEIMTREVASCTQTNTLSDAARIMWERDCGAVPVVDEQNRAVGIVTDRDICIASATRGAAPYQIPVRDLMRTTLYTCRAEDEVEESLDTMRKQGVRRLPVVDTDGKLCGIFSLTNVLLQADKLLGARARPAFYEKVFSTFKGICERKGICEHPTKTTEPLQRTAAF